MHIKLLTAPILALALAAACSSESPDAGAETASGSAAATQGADAGGEQAMSTMHEDTLAQRMETHLAALDQSAPRQWSALLPEHRRLVTAMIEDCRQMMRQMNMTAPAKWTDLETALNQDLDRMGQMPAEQLQAFLPEHRQRVQSLLDMRHDMM